MKYNTALDEIIKVDGSFSKPVEFAEQHLISGIIQTVTESSESRFKLVGVNISWIVLIETAEAILPLSYIVP